MAENLRYLIKQHVNTILLHSTFADSINPSARISEIITFPEDIPLIKERIKTRFKLDIHQDISDFTVNQLYTMIFMFVQNSNHNKLGWLSKPKKPQIKQPQHTNDTKNVPKQNKGLLWDRKAIFGYILGNLRTAYGRSVQSTEKISNLIEEAQNTGMNSDALISKLQELEKFFDIKIDQGMRVYNIGNLAEKSLVVQGKAIDPRIRYESMEPLWATIHTALSMNYWQSVILHDLNVRISTYKLNQIKSFPEFERLVANAKQRKER